MDRSPKLRFLSYDEIRRVSEEYAGRFRLAQTIPVDIDRLADNVLQINVIPFSSLYRSYEVNAFLSSDFSKIYVDEYLYTHLEPQYRFTLAHELGHMVLHGEYYRQFKIDDLKTYVDFVARMKDDDYRLIETQANNFAGLFLVSTSALRERFLQEAADIVRFISTRFKGQKREGYLETAVELIARRLRPIFHVHHQPIQIRIEREGLTSEVP